MRATNDWLARRTLQVERKQDMAATAKRNRGFTYVELTLAVVLGGMLVLGLAGVVGQALDTQSIVHTKTELARQASEAMARMVGAVAHTRRLILPLADNPNTTWPENIREQTEPPSPPLGDSTRASAVLAVTLPADVDLDQNGIPDADNDGDGRLDEDVPGDNNNDGAPGVSGVDDDGDGSADISAAAVPFRDNDEDGMATEDAVDGIDNDGDGSVDEDPAGDLNKDGASGLAGIDDDDDGAIDEENQLDDDEDGAKDEDGYDTLVFYLDNGSLKERLPVPWDTNGDSQVTGADFVTSTIAEHVSRFRVERILPGGGRYQLVGLTLELTSPETGEVVSLAAQVRVGGSR